jgi:hypothetical protein
MAVLLAAKMVEVLVARRVSSMVAHWAVLKVEKTVLKLGSLMVESMAEPWAERKAGQLAVQRVRQWVAKRAVLTVS